MADDAMAAPGTAEALGTIGGPVLVAAPGRGLWLSADGEIEPLAAGAIAVRLAEAGPPLVCHAPATARRIGLAPFPARDLLELFAFARPARFCEPTPMGLARALGLTPPTDHVDEALTLSRAAVALLAEIGGGDDDDQARARAIASAMAAAGWPWGKAVVAALGGADEAGGGLDVWSRLPEWSEQAPPGQPGGEPVDPAETRRRLAALLGADAEPRPEQADYASAVTAAFQASAGEGPEVVLAEAGTGVGKTLGYIAPVGLWAERNRAPVWISTYTKNLQRQIDGELDRLYPDPALKARKVVLRKGRENYLCLLNLEDATRALGLRRGDAAGLGLTLRWVGATRDGDMIGGDFPGWLAGLVGHGRGLGLTDRRGECIYAACPHYRKCFIERGIRRARRADIVIANHALVMTQAALAAATGDEGGYLPTRYVFDEGHHVFDAADSAFAAHLTGLETAELRRWLLGAEGGRRSRARGLERRLEGLVADDDAGAALEAIKRAARALPGPGWPERIAGDAPRGPAEAFLATARRQVLARRAGRDDGYSLETETAPPIDGLTETATALEAALTRLAEPVAVLGQALVRRLDEDAETLDTPSRLRIEAACRGLARRGVVTIGAWRQMLAALGGETPPEMIDWLAVDRIDGRERDVGLYRHWVDPTIPFIAQVARPAQGMVITSATLRDASGDAEADWRAAEGRTGTCHLERPAIRAALPSPFDYAARTRVLIVTDVRRTAPDQVAAAYRELMRAAGGGGLGLFTAIARLRAVHARIAVPLDNAGLTLHAQHVDALDAATLVDIFRAQENACLLGTDAMRDGIDVPGRGLRLIVFDRVPWPRPGILHRARRRRFSGGAYDDMLTRLRLRQAFGRLIRRADDRGVFVLLDPAMPSRLLGAFPEGTSPRRVGLAEAIAETRAFLAPDGS